MSPLINKSVTDFLELCDEHSKEGKPFDINEFVFAYLLENESSI